MNATDTFDMQLDAQAPDIGELVNRLQVCFDARGLPSKLFQSFAMAFDEVISNIAAYGSAHDPIRIRVTFGADDVRAEVIDDGVAFDPLQLPDPDVTSSVDERAIGGLGVYLVRKMMDDVAYERRERFNCLMFRKRIVAAPDLPRT
ncbi:anti-sigma regulatory factor [Burkholderia sp. KK1]|uniref:ATP-binding protein n=1 Tax=Caballeronia sp. CLC5 TaxID=2906764 RepID=UPI00023874D9|nr:ATP-binding protein [Caballeronia sp. CLC5]AET92978.1 anti-sigma regulatory factor [Burkholderia sp. YI23]AQH02337.1 anti-sigma regulatory factor [Burkholderia sp. KK1]MCE4574540.1 ATP-binding protein [Caballeronia sp. CLC5]BBP99920.1 histidine kinase [Burkholderia sp. SFA1]